MSEREHMILEVSIRDITAAPDEGYLAHAEIAADQPAALLQVGNRQVIVLPERYRLVGCKLFREDFEPPALQVIDEMMGEPDDTPFRGVRWSVGEVNGREFVGTGDTFAKAVAAALGQESEAPE